MSSYVEIVAGETQTTTKDAEGRCPVWNALFLLELCPNAHVIELVVKAKPSALNPSANGDNTLGTATILLSDLPECSSSSRSSTWHENWYHILPPVAGFAVNASIKVLLCPHILPELFLNRPRRAVGRMHDNASKGIGTFELVVVAGKQLPADPLTGTRTALVTVSAGSCKASIDWAPPGLNPVWNTPVTLDITPDVHLLSVNMLDKAASSQFDKSIGEVGSCSC